MFMEQEPCPRNNVGLWGCSCTQEDAVLVLEVLALTGLAMWSQIVIITPHFLRVLLYQITYLKINAEICLGTPADLLAAARC